MAPRCQPRPELAACLSGVAVCSGFGHGKEYAGTSKPRVSSSPSAFSPDGKILATSSGYAETVIRLWDVASGQELRPLTVILAASTTCCSGRMVQSWPRPARTRRSESGILHPVNRSPRYAATDMRYGVLALLPDNKTLVSASKDGSVRLWDATDVGRDLAYIRLPSPLRTWCFDADNRSVLTVDHMGKAARWHGTDLKEMQPLFEVSASVVSSGFSPDLFSPDRRLLATALRNGVVHVWDLQAATLITSSRPILDGISSRVSVPCDETRRPASR